MTVIIGQQTQDSKDPKKFNREYRWIDGTDFKQQSFQSNNETQLHRIGGVFYSHEVDNQFNYTVLYSMDKSSALLFQ